MTMNVMACCEVVIVYYKFVKANKFHRPMLTNEKYSENCRWREREKKKHRHQTSKSLPTTRRKKAHQLNPVKTRNR